MRVRRGSGKDEANRVAERPASWMGIRYSHSSNREGEPLIHDHVHVSTLVQNRDGGFQRLWSRALFARGGAVLEALGHRHEAELREAISEEIPGIRWGELGENGTALVEQVPEALRDALSTRTRKRIDPVVAEWEAANRMPATSAVRQMIALQTRQKKDLAAVMTREQVETVALQHGVDEMTMLREIVTAPPAKQREHATREGDRGSGGERGGADEDDDCVSVAGGAVGGVTGGGAGVADRRVRRGRSSRTRGWCGSRPRKRSSGRRSSWLRRSRA